MTEDDDMWEYWTTQPLAEEILDFLRESNLIVALDDGVWIYAGNATSQLAAHLAKIEDETLFDG